MGWTERVAEASGFVWVPETATRVETDEFLLVRETVTAVVQVAGKVRARLTVPPDIGEDALRDLALADPAVVRALADRPVRAVIVRPPTLVNVVPG